MNRLTKFIERHISGKKVLLLFILTNIIYVFMLSVTIPKNNGILKWNEIVGHDAYGI